MVDLDVKFAEQIELIVEHFEQYANVHKLKSSILGLIRDSIYKEYFDFINLDKVLVDHSPMPGELIIRVYFLDTKIATSSVVHPRSITRILFDNPKYLEYNRMKLIRYIKSK